MAVEVKVAGTSTITVPVDAPDDTIVVVEISDKPVIVTVFVTSTSGCPIMTVPGVEPDAGIVVVYAVALRLIYTVSVVMLSGTPTMMVSIAVP